MQSIWEASMVALVKVTGPLTALLLASGCTTNLTTEKLLPTPTTESGTIEANRFDYYLPKKEITATVSYRLVRCDPDGAKIARTATVTFVDSADLDQHYAIKYEDLDNMFKTSTFEAKRYPDGTLKSVGATIDDRSAGIAKAVVGTVLSVAKTAVTGLTLMTLGDDAQDASGQAATCTPRAIDLVNSLEAIQDDLRTTRGDADERAAMVDAAQRITALLTASSARKAVWANANQPEPREPRVAIPGPASFSSLVEGELPGNCLTVSRKTGVRDAETTEDTAPSQAKQPVLKGILYREPVAAEVVVYGNVKHQEYPCILETEKQTTLVSETVRIPQLGGLRFITLNNGAFDKNNVSLLFAPDGTLESMGYGSESRLERAAGATADSADLIQGFAAERGSLRDTQAAKEVQAKLDLVRAQADLIEAEQKLQALQATQALDSP